MIIISNYCIFTSNKKPYLQCLTVKNAHINANKNNKLCIVYFLNAIITPLQNKNAAFDKNNISFLRIAIKNEIII